jgi:hypothetical protein
VYSEKYVPGLAEHEIKSPDVSAGWLSLVLHILEILSSNLSLEIFYPD